MKPLAFAALLLVLFSGCKTTKNYVTNTNGPVDWQPPVVSWQSPPEAVVRGRVGMDACITDSSRVDSAVLFVDGLDRQRITASPYRFEVETDSLEDGFHLLECRAWDQYGNLGISPILRVHVQNQPLPGPRLLWVPSDFPTIQAAINAAADFDTIRVKDGTYYETLNLFGKGIWIESEHGPTRCMVNDSGANNAFLVVACSTPATIRGFWITGTGYLLGMREGAQANFYNNIVVSDSADGTVFAINCAGNIDNNIFMGSWAGVQIGYMWGRFFNNILRDVTSTAFWNMSDLRNPLLYGYDLFWNNHTNYNDRFVPGPGDLVEDPMLDLAGGRPMPGSPTINAGNPEILDRDNSRSDIGPFGGPYAY
jgi:hypothetical protein